MCLECVNENHLNCVWILAIVATETKRNTIRNSSRENQLNKYGRRE